MAGDDEDSVVFKDSAGQVVFELEALETADAQARPEFAGLLGQAYFAGKAPRSGVEVQLCVSNNSALGICIYIQGDKVAT